MDKKVKYTGYWILFCNPKEWKIEDFLKDLKNKKINRFDSWTITKWQYDYFKPGQFGIIRVGVDKRLKSELNGHKRLESGVYAIVRILSTPKLKIERIGHRDKYYANKDSSFIKNEYYVEIEYITNLIENPLTFNYIKEYVEITNDRYLIPGFQASTIPLSENAFNKLVELSDTKLEISNKKNIDVECIYQII